jgi:hypothetical protein
MRSDREQSALIDMLHNIALAEDFRCPSSRFDVRKTGPAPTFNEKSRDLR